MSKRYLAITLVITLIIGLGMHIPRKAAKKPFTVVIDAGHGGHDPGAIGYESSIPEKTITLAISNEIKKQAKNKKIKFLYTREGDDFLTLKERTALTSLEEPDLFISIHLNNSAKIKTGYKLFYSDSNQFADLSQQYCQIVANELALIGDPFPFTGIKQANFFVLKKTACPSFLIDLGSISKPKDLAWLTHTDNQAELASQLIDVIEQLEKHSH